MDSEVGSGNGFPVLINCVVWVVTAGVEIGLPFVLINWDSCATIVWVGAFWVTGVITIDACTGLTNGVQEGISSKVEVIRSDESKNVGIELTCVVMIGAGTFTLLCLFK